MPTKFIKKLALLVGAATVTSTLYVGPLRADDSITYLQQIAANTLGILNSVNNIPTYIENMLEYIMNMQKHDDSAALSAMQGNFTATGNALTQDVNMQLTAQATLNTDLLGPNATKETLPNANDLVFSTMLGQPIYSPDPRNPAGAPATANPPYNYIKNAAGINLPHVFPRMNWRGTPNDQVKYNSYYNTITAIESFNGYVLSNQLAELQNNNALSTAQLSLVSQVTNASDWIAQVASEEMGKVLRQILLFESQTYVLMTQLLQTQKQLLAAQVMTNALLIGNNQQNEGTLLNKAQGVPLTG